MRENVYAQKCKPSRSTARALMNETSDSRNDGLRVKFLALAEVHVFAELKFVLSEIFSAALVEVDIPHNAVFRIHFFPQGRHTAYLVIPDMRSADSDNMRAFGAVGNSFSNCRILLPNNLNGIRHSGSLLG